MKAAQTYALNCMTKMTAGEEVKPGKPWIKFNQMTGRNEFAFIEVASPCVNSQALLLKHVLVFFT